MTRLLILVGVAVMLGAATASAKPSYSCTVTPDPALGGRIDGAQEWTAIHNQKGAIDDWTSRIIDPGEHTAELLDMPKGGLANGPATVISDQHLHDVGLRIGGRVH